MKCYVCDGLCDIDVIQSEYKYWKCTNCFTSQVLPRPAQDILKTYYDSYHLSDAQGGVYDQFEHRMREDFAAKVILVKKYSPIKKPHLLDVGCGKGFFVKEARDNDIVAQGIDLSESGISHAVDILGVPARVGKMEDQTDGDWKEKFDVITFWATIEHLPDPHLTLDAIYKCLKPNGIVIMDTGLGNHHLEKFLPGYNQWYIAPEHLFVFSEIGLVSLVRKAGFKVIFVNENFERSYFRKIIRAFRHDLICLAAGLLLGPLLGKRSRFKMKREAKWAIGNLITVVCQK